jgi:hypothetical protein
MVHEIYCSEYVIFRVLLHVSGAIAVCYSVHVTFQMM